MENILEQNIRNFSWILAKEKKEFSKRGIETGKDLLLYLPRKYEDRSKITKIKIALEASVRDPEFIATIIATCDSVEHFSFRNRQIKKYFFSDGTDFLTLSAFNPAHRFVLGKVYILCGRLKKKYQEMQLLLHEAEKFDKEDEKKPENLHMGRVVPIYSLTENLSQKRLRFIIKTLFEKVEKTSLHYAFDTKIAAKKKMNSKYDNLQQMHFPNSFEQLEKARRELIYEEFFVMQQKIALKKKENCQGKEKNRYASNSLQKIKEIINHCPFTLTAEQKKAIQEIFSDMFGEQVMFRLIQGEVGSGKTLVAFYAMVLAAINDCQAAMMAPTDILAKQHYLTFSQLAQPFNIKVYLLVAQQTTQDRKKTLHALANEKSLLVVGTHALIQKDVDFCHLTLAVIDEQHRFGVDQRKQLQDKGYKVDFLSLSATPIPRSLSLTIFGDQECSELHERPAASSNVQSKVIFEEDRPRAYRFMLKQIVKGEQGYVVFPVIEESEKLKSLIKEYHKLKEQVFKSFPTAFIHGRIKVEERDRLMEQFRKNLIKVLFCTTVLEVGIDHPNATVMIIESAHQFGISQLHQLRGRVGRHDKPGFCYLATKQSMNTQSIERLQAFSQTNDGFKISELDLQIRGPGELVGNKQSGFLELHFGSLSQHYDILVQARKDAFSQVFDK